MRRSLAFQQIRRDRIKSILEFSHVGGLGLDLTNNTAQLFLHVDDFGNAENAKWITPLSDNGIPTNTSFDGRNVMVTFNPAAESIESNLRLPPSSSVTFVSDQSDLAAIVIGDYRDSFTSPFYNSDLDDGILPKFKTDNTFPGAIWDSSNIALICATATRAARSVWFIRMPSFLRSYA